MPQEKVITRPPLISANGNGHHFDAGSSEAVKRAIRYNAEQDSSWRYSELARTLYKWGDLFASELIDPVAKIGVKSMPTPVIGFEPDDIRVNAYYLLKENPVGVNDQVILNERRLDRPLYGILESLCHEMCHLWQQRRGEHPIKNSKNSHNAEFVEKMEAMGLHPLPIVGCHWKPADGVFEELLKKHGVLKPEVKPTEPGIKIDWWSEVKPKGQSTLTKYECPTCGLKVRVGVQHPVRIRCEDCSDLLGKPILFIADLPKVRKP